MYLHQVDDHYSQYITNLIDKDRLARLDPIFIKKRREELHEEIKKLDHNLKSHKENSDQVREILETGLSMYQVRNEETYIGPSQNRVWIRANVLPKLKKAGSKLSEYDVLKMFEEGNIE